MKLVSPILNPQFLSPITTYFFIESRKAALNLTKAVQTLLIYIQLCLVDVAPEIYSLDAFDLKDRITSVRRKTMRDLVPKATPPHQAKTTYDMQAAPSAPAPPAPYKKSVMPAKRWKLQKLALCIIFNVRSLDSLPKIWRTLDSRKKKNRWSELEIARQQNVREIIYKPPHISYAVAGLILRL